MSEDNELWQYRKMIDETDDQIQRLISQRATLALEVCRIKLKYHGAQVEIKRPMRENEILLRLIKQNLGPLSDKSVELIFKSIIGACRELQISHVKRIG